VIKSDPKTFFGYVDLKKKRVGYPSVMHFERRMASGPEKICDLFAEYIQRTYTDDVWVPSDPGPEHVSADDPPFGALHFTSDEVESVLQDFDVNKGSGPDGIPPIIFKNCASAFAKPLSLLFNRSMATSVFPDRWKVSYVTPTFKKGRRNRLIPSIQIFDRVRHQLLLNEMSVGVELARCMWLGSYMSERIQKIRIGDAVSKAIKVTSVVPQGSHVGPLCFIWFVNRISEIFDYVRVLFYADDMKLFLPVSGFQDCLKIQSDLNKLSEWCERNSLLLNVGKFKTITFARSRHPLEFAYILGGTVLDRVSSINDR
jgi:hypothetical protein